MAISSRVAAYLKNLARGGDMFAKVYADNMRQVKLTAADEAADAIVVTAQVQDALGNPVSGVANLVVRLYGDTEATLADGGVGTVKVGASSQEMWMQTDSNGTAEISVAQNLGDAGDYLVEVTTADGEVAMLVVTFA